MSQTSNKKIAINTIFLYLRKLITLFISLYTSRLLLQHLGVTDFGIYGLVGSIVLMFNALRSIFSSSIQRFINIAKGKKSAEEVNVIFNLGVKIHRWIALFFLIAIEIGGLIMMHFLNIPIDKHTEAYTVLQFSIFTAAITILTIPYDALIIANEKFDTFALFSIIDYSLRLLVAYLLIYSPVSRLIVYSALLLFTTIIILCVNIIYCRIKFPNECRYMPTNHPQLFKEMTTFAGWQFLGNTAYAITNNGINFILNLMGGVTINAARTIAHQVMSAISQFISDLNLSFQPQTMKNYGQGDHQTFLHLLYINTKANLAIAFIGAFPVFILATPILEFWLAEVPPHAVGFLQALMVYLVVRSLHAPIDLYFKSHGNIKAYQIVELCILTLSLPISYFILSIGFPYYSVFLTMAVCEAINIIALIFLAHRQHGFNISSYYRHVICRASVCLIIFTTTGYLLITYINLADLTFFKFFVFSILLIFATLIIVVISLLTPKEIQAIATSVKIKKQRL